MAMFQYQYMPEEHTQIMRPLVEESNRIFKEGSKLFENTYKEIKKNLQENYRELYEASQEVNEILDYGKYHKNAESVITLIKKWRSIADMVYNADRGWFSTSLTSNYWELVKEVDKIIEYYDTNKSLPPFVDLAAVYKLCSNVERIEVDKIRNDNERPTLYVKFYHIANFQYILDRILSSYNSYR